MDLRPRNCTFNLSFCCWRGVNPGGLISEFRIGISLTKHDKSGLVAVPLVARFNRILYSLYELVKNSGRMIGCNNLKQCSSSDVLVGAMSGTLLHLLCAKKKLRGRSDFILHAL